MEAFPPGHFADPLVGLFRNLVPSGVFEQSKSEVGEANVADAGASHFFIEQQSPFPMRSSRSLAPVVFKRQSADRIAQKILPGIG